MRGTNIIQLRQLLKEKFPGLRTNPEEFSPDTRTFWPTGLPQIDTLLQGGFAKGALTEIVAAQRTAAVREPSRGKPLFAKRFQESSRPGVEPSPGWLSIQPQST